MIIYLYMYIYRNTMTLCPHTRTHENKAPGQTRCLPVDNPRSAPAQLPRRPEMCSVQLKVMHGLGVLPCLSVFKVWFLLLLLPFLGVRCLKLPYQRCCRGFEGLGFQGFGVQRWVLSTAWAFRFGLNFSGLDTWVCQNSFVHCVGS